MIAWDASHVAGVLGAEQRIDGRFESVSTDTRSLKRGALFVALVGEKFDGHKFLEEARERGTLGAVVKRGTAPVDGLGYFEVNDTLAALGLLACERRREIAGPVVAVTGSNGKTATKEMLAAALGTKWVVHATRENLNNLVGVPLTVLDAPAICDCLVVEVGASEPGEVARLRRVVEPSIGVVTNVAVAHLEGFGTVERVLQEKISLLENVQLAVVGTNPPSLAARAAEVAQRVVTAGLGEAARVRPADWGLDARGRGWLDRGGVRVALPLVGRHQLDNALLALAVAEELGLDRESVAAALGKVRLPPGRCEVLTGGDRTVLHDAYNANPASLTALLETARVLRGGRPLVVVLGTMLELGDNSAKLHAEMAGAVMAAEPDMVAVLGEFVPAFERFARDLGDRLLTADDPESLGRLVAGRLSGGELVLVKGSHGMRLERAVPYLLLSSETSCSTTS